MNTLTVWPWTALESLLLKMGTWRVVVLMREITYEECGLVPEMRPVPPTGAAEVQSKVPEPGSVPPLPAETGDLGLVGGAG